MKGGNIPEPKEQFLWLPCSYINHLFTTSALRFSTNHHHLRGLKAKSTSLPQSTREIQQPWTVTIGDSCHFRMMNSIDAGNPYLAQDNIMLNASSNTHACSSCGSVCCARHSSCQGQEVPLNRSVLFLHALTTPFLFAPKLESLQHAAYVPDTSIIQLPVDQDNDWSPRARPR